MQCRAALKGQPPGMQETCSQAGCEHSSLVLAGAQRVISWVQTLTSRMLAVQLIHLFPGTPSRSFKAMRLNKAPLRPACSAGQP